jgi:hypothetical protein
MDWSESPSSREREKIQDISVIAPVFIDPDVFKEKRSSFKSLRDFEMLVSDGLIVMDILGPYPWRFQKLYRVRQFSVKAEISWILEVACLVFFAAPRGMAVVIDMFVVIRTLPQADIIQNQLQIALHGLADRFKGFELTVDMLIDDDFFHAHVFVLQGFSHGIDPGGSRDLDFEARKTRPHKLDQVGKADGHRIGARMVNPFQEVDELCVTFFRIFEVAKTGGINKIAEFQSSIMTGLDVIFYIFPVYLWKNEARPCPSDDIERKFAKESVHGCPLNGIQEGNIPVGSNP